jgi:drug/metabolite transporter (DMT)-like permease
MNPNRQSYLFAGLAILLWSSIPTAFKICLNELNILPMLTIASITSTIVLFKILISDHKLSLLKNSSAKDLLNSAILGLINPSLYYLILLKAYQLLPAQIAQPLNMIWPIILVFLSVPMLKQKIELKSFVALFISFAGVYIISSQGNPFSSVHSDINGVLLATGSSVFWAFYFIFNVMDKRDEAVKLFLNFLFGSIYLLIAMTVTRGWESIIFSEKGFLSAIYIGCFEMGVSFFFWLKALQIAPTTDKISNLVYIAPFLSLFFVHFILHEPVYYTTPAGLILIVAGILVQTRKPAGV